MKIAAKKHDIIGFRVSDPREAELPDVGLLQIRDPETGETGWIDTHDGDARAYYNLTFKKIKMLFTDILKK